METLVRRELSPDKRDEIGEISRRLASHYKDSLIRMLTPWVEHTEVPLRRDISDEAGFGPTAETLSLSIQAVHQNHEAGSIERRERFLEVQGRGFRNPTTAHLLTDLVLIYEDSMHEMGFEGIDYLGVVLDEIGEGLGKSPSRTMAKDVFGAILTWRGRQIEEQATRSGWQSVQVDWKPILESPAGGDKKSS